jgi:peptidoglycan/xylan/chitin deacetylase (PgdA/CDA1 family)
MNLLAWQGFKAVPLNALLDKDLPKKPVVITFDDGYQDNYLYAFPVLKEYKFCATIFLVSGHIGGTNQWDSQQKEPVRLLSQDEIREMADYGISFGAHTVTHPHLPQLTDDRAFYEITQSKREIEEVVGKEVVSFCYPYGEVSLRVKEMVAEAGFRCACACDTESCDPYKLPRRQIFSKTSLFGFWRKIQRWYPEYTRLRKLWKR